MKLLKMTFCALLAMQIGAYADGPASHAPGDRNNGSSDGESHARRYGNTSGGAGMFEGLGADPEENKLALDFLKTNSPERYKVYEEIGPKERPGLNRLMVMRYREMQAIQKDDPEIYGLKIQEIKVEDDLFALVGQYRKTDATSRPSIEAQVRDKVKSLLELRMKERDRRIARLQSAQDEARKNEDADVARKTKQELDGPEKISIPRIGAGGHMGQGGGAHSAPAATQP